MTKPIPKEIYLLNNFAVLSSIAQNYSQVALAVHTIGTGTKPEVGIINDLFKIINQCIESSNKISRQIELIDKIKNHNT